MPEMLVLGSDMNRGVGGREVRAANLVFQGRPTVIKMDK